VRESIDRGNEGKRVERVGKPNPFNLRELDSKIDTEHVERRDKVSVSARDLDKAKGRRETHLRISQFPRFDQMSNGQD
jgi:hypothetical protein